MARYKLKLKRLDFISAVDSPAQETATAVLVKRRGRNGQAQIEARARVVKTSDELGLVFGWALTSKARGADYFDLHGDNIVEDDLIRVAAEFMENSAATDEMHDFEKDGRVVFAMPLTAEVAKSFGIQTDTTGLMVAIKPSPEVYAKFKSGEYTGFSIAGIGERVEVKSAGKVVKSQLYTNEVDGHAHCITVCEDGTMYASYATAEGAEFSHSHAVVFEDGRLVILADSGHTHELAEGQPGVAVVPADAIVVVQERESDDEDEEVRARAAKSTRHNASRKMDATNEAKTMKTIVLTEAQYAHYSKLNGEAAETFLAKSFDERNAEIEKALAADPVVFKGELTGIEVRKSHGEVALKLAQRAEENERKLAEQAEALRKRDEEIEKAAVRKLAADVLGGMPGDDETHDYIVASLRKGGDHVKAEKALETLRGMKASSAIGKNAPGAGGADPQPSTIDKQGAFEALEKGLLAFAKENSITKNVWTDGLAQFAKTEKGAALKRAYDEALAAR